MIKTWNIILTVLLLLQTGRHGVCEELCYQDLLYLVDSSGSIGNENFQKIKSSIVESSEIFHDSLATYLQAGVLQYSSLRKFSSPSKLGSCPSVQCFKDNLSRNMKHIGGLTYTAAAIKRATEVDFDESANVNVSLKHLIIFTDGAATDSKDLLKSYNLTMGRNISVYAIGIGSNVNTTQLRQSANGGISDERVVLSTYESISHDVKRIVRNVLGSCESSLFAFQPMGNESCASVLGVGHDEPAKISASKPTLNQMKKYLTQPVWPQAFDQLEIIDIPLLSLLDIFTQTSVPVNYTIPINCSLTNLTEVTSFPRAASLDDVGILDAELKCVYLDRKTRKFSTYGVSTVNKMSTEYYCVSNHTTIFAALMSLTTFSIPPRVKILSYIVGGISVFFLLVTIAVLLKVRRRLRSKRTVVQINLAVALTFFQTLILFSDVARSDDSGCQAIAVLSHYFLLSSAAWMLLEGFTLAEHTFGNTLRNENTRNERILKITLGWGIPAVVVIVATSVGFTTDSYMEKTPRIVTQSYPQLGRFVKCWMTPGSLVQILSLILPVCLVLLINLFILVRAGLFVFKMSKKRDKFKATAERDSSTNNVMPTNLTHAQAAFRAMLMLLPALGTPWCLSLIQITSHGYLYWYVTTVGLQGFFLFLVYIPLNHDVRKALVQAWNRRSIGNSFQLNNSHQQVSQTQRKTENGKTSQTKARNE